MELGVAGYAAFIDLVINALITAIGLSQVIQLPISTFATIGNVLNSLIDWELFWFWVLG